jgi:hypothetical protein
VQQTGYDGGQIEFELSDYQSDVEGMGDVGLSRLALLIAVHPRRILISAVNQASISLRIVFLNPVDQLFRLVGRFSDGG